MPSLCRRTHIRCSYQASGFAGRGVGPSEVRSRRLARVGVVPSEYEQMIIGVYAVLGIFLIMASRNPARHVSLIWFTVWSSLVHGLIMLWQARPDDSAGTAGAS